MNYQYELMHTYNLNLGSMTSGSFVLFKNDGSIFTTANVLVQSNRYSDYCNYFAKYCTDNSVNAWGYLYIDFDMCYLVCTNSVDYVMLQNTTENSSYSRVDAYELANNGNNVETTFGSGSYYYGYGGQYAYYFGYEPDTSSYYGTHYAGDLYYNYVTYFDYSMCWHPEDSYYYNYQVHQFNYNDNPYYFYQQHLVFDKVSSFSIGYGQVNSRGDIGYSYYQSGYNDGYKDGYDVGISLDRNTANAFSYIEQAFNAVGGIMSLEIIPHVTLGLCFSIPLVVVLITTLFKLIKK